MIYWNKTSAQCCTCFPKGKYTLIILSIFLLLSHSCLPNNSKEIQQVRLKDKQQKKIAQAMSLKKTKLNETCSLQLRELCSTKRNIGNTNVSDALNDHDKRRILHECTTFLHKFHLPYLVSIHEALSYQTQHASTEDQKKRSNQQQMQQAQGIQHVKDLLTRNDVVALHTYVMNLK